MFISIILLIYYGYIYLFTIDYENHISKMNPNFQKVFRFNIPSFNKDIRKWIIDKAEEYTKKNGWDTDRHIKYQTTDISVGVLDTDIKQYIIDHIKTDIFPLMSKASGIPIKRLRSLDVFIIKYEMDNQVSLKKHKDGSTFTFTMLLNDPSEFEGGGTYFHNHIGLVKPTNEEVIMHSGYIQHEGKEITKGKRYLLVGFVWDQSDYNYKDLMKFKTTRYYTLNMQK